MVAQGEGEILFGMTVMIAGGGAFISDAAFNEMPAPEEPTRIARQTALEARHLGYAPRVAALSFAVFILGLSPFYF